jgi:hypothetical protein
MYSAYANTPSFRPIAEVIRLLNLAPRFLGGART